MFRLAVLASLLLARTSAIGAQDWPSFRGPNASGIGDGPALASSWNGETLVNVAWKTPIPGLGHSSPIVWGDRVFLTTALSSDESAAFDPRATSGRLIGADSTARQSWRVLALDKNDGRILWERTLHEGRPSIKRHPKGTFANETPATDGERLVVFLGSEGLFALDLAGNVLWKRELGVLDAGYVGLPDYQWGTASSPLLYDGKVIVQCDSRQGSFLAAFDAATGEPLWRQDRDELPSWSTPIIYKGEARTEVITNSPRFFRGSDPATGEVLWTVADGAEVKVPTPVLGEGLVFFVGGAPRGREFYAIRPGGTEVRVAWRAPKGGPYTPTPLFYRGHLYVLADNGVLTSYEPRTGEVVAQRRVPERGGEYSGSPVAANGRIYLSSQDGDVHRVKAGPELELTGSFPMGEALMATPAISGGTLLVRGARHLFAVRPPE